MAIALQVKIVQILAVCVLCISVFFARRVISRMNAGGPNKPALKNFAEGVLAGGLIGAFISAGIVLSNSLKPIFANDPDFVLNQMITFSLITGCGMLFGSIRILNKPKI